MRALVVQHAASEGPGWLAEWLPAGGVDLEVIHPYLADLVPEALTADALIVLGGGMGATEDERAPWLPAVRRLLRAAVTADVPTLGICLGAQLLAVATGGVVERGPAGPELGLDEVVIDVADDLFVAGRLPVVQWHYDTVTSLPPDAELLGSSGRYPVQAFRVGRRAWGLQFHIEATPDMVRAWGDEEGVPQVADDVAVAEAQLAAAGQPIAARFAAIVTVARASCQRHTAR